MEMSQDIKELATALAKAQAAIKHAAKDSVNPHFNSSYADLASVWEACRGPLTDNGLSVVQMPEESEGGVSLTTLLIHTSGQYVKSTVTMPLDRKTPQAVGSAITYARRYALAAVTSVSPDDDDAEGATNRDRTQPQPRTSTKKPAPKSDPKPKPFNADEAREKCLVALGARDMKPAEASVIHKAWANQHEAETGEAPGRDAYANFYRNITKGAYDAPKGDDETDVPFTGGAKSGQMQTNEAA